MSWLTLVIIAVSLSMDTFSLSLIYGTLSLKKKMIWHLSVLVGIFHFFMPILGDKIGEYLLKLITINPEIIIGVIFLSLALQMSYSLFKKEEIKHLNNFLSLLFFAFTVSVDSFSVGIGLEAITKNNLLASSIFMIVSFSFTYFGLCLGTKLEQKFGKMATFVGSMLLFSLALYYLL